MCMFVFSPLMSDLTNSMLGTAIHAIRGSIGSLQTREVHTKEGNIRRLSFKVKSIIGRGTFGLVSVIETKDGTQALKTVYQDNKYCNRELDILLDIDHPNIIRLSSYFYACRTSVGHYLNLCFEYMPTSMEDYVKDKTVCVADIKKLYSQAICALQYIHALGICHRDIKPSNLLVDGKMNLKICDFGSAKYMLDGTENTPYICSRYYRAPENLFNDPKYTLKIDVWATALVFCEFRVHKPVFFAETSKEMLERIFEKIQVPKKILDKYNFKPSREYKPFDMREYLFSLFHDPNLVEALERSLKIDPDERISAREIIDLRLLC